MIFATIGTQAPFDRFIKILDSLAANIDEEVVAQTIKSDYKAENIKIVGFLAPDEFNDYFAKARIIVAHAGMGTIISALKQQKPIVVMPRLASLGEHRNDHQMATAMRLNELGYVYVAYDKKQLGDLLLKVELQPLKQIGESASQTLIDSLLKDINQK